MLRMLQQNTLEYVRMIQKTEYGQTLVTERRKTIALLSTLPLPLLLPLPSGWITSSAEAVHQLRPNAQPRHNQTLGKSISSSYELDRMHNLHRVKS